MTLPQREADPACLHADMESRHGDGSPPASRRRSCFSRHPGVEAASNPIATASSMPEPAPALPRCRDEGGRRPEVYEEATPRSRPNTRLCGTNAEWYRGRLESWSRGLRGWTSGCIGDRGRTLPWARRFRCAPLRAVPNPSRGGELKEEASGAAKTRTSPWTSSASVVPQRNSRSSGRVPPSGMTGTAEIRAAAYAIDTLRCCCVCDPASPVRIPAILRQVATERTGSGPFAIRDVPTSACAGVARSRGLVSAQQQLKEVVCQYPFGKRSPGRGGGHRPIRWGPRRARTAGRRSRECIRRRRTRRRDAVETALYARTVQSGRSGVPDAHAAQGDLQAIMTWRSSDPGQHCDTGVYRSHSSGVTIFEGFAGSKEA